MKFHLTAPVAMTVVIHVALVALAIAIMILVTLPDHYSPSNMTNSEVPLMLTFSLLVLLPQIVMLAFMVPKVKKRFTTFVPLGRHISVAISVASSLCALIISAVSRSQLSWMESAKSSASIGNIQAVAASMLTPVNGTVSTTSTNAVSLVIQDLMTDSWNNSVAVTTMTSLTFTITVLQAAWMIAQHFQNGRRKSMGSDRSRVMREV